MKMSKPFVFPVENFLATKNRLAPHWPRRWLAKTRTGTLLLTTRPKSDILLNSDRSTKTLYFIERVCQTLHFSREKIHHSKSKDFSNKIIQIIKNVKTLCFSSRKFSPNVKSHVAPRKVAKTRRRTLGLPTTKPQPTNYQKAIEAKNVACHNFH